MNHEAAYICSLMTSREGLWWGTSRSALMQAADTANNIKESVRLFILHSALLGSQGPIEGKAQCL